LILNPTSLTTNLRCLHLSSNAAGQRKDHLDSLGTKGIRTCREPCTQGAQQSPNTNDLIGNEPLVKFPIGNCEGRGHFVL
jgi:hypothetical protein